MVLDALGWNQFCVQKDEICPSIASKLALD